MVFTHYQAETAELTGAKAVPDEYAFAGAYAEGLDSDGDQVEWKNVHGSKHLTIRYSTTNAPGKLALYVNGEFRRLAEFPETAFNNGKWAWNEVKLYDLNLPEGADIRLQFHAYKDCRAVNIDSIIIRTHTLVQDA